jgi:hypothetical protein
MIKGKIIQKLLMILPKIILPSKIPGLRHWRLWRHACPAAGQGRAPGQALFFCKSGQNRG